MTTPLLARRDRTYLQIQEELQGHLDRGVCDNCPANVTFWLRADTVRGVQERLDADVAGQVTECVVSMFDDGDETVVTVSGELIAMMRYFLLMKAFQDRAAR